MKKTPKIDIKGMHFGHWTVLSRSKSDSNGNDKWECVCDCGLMKTCFGNNLRRGLSESCGCQRPAIIRKLKTKHGHTSQGKVSAEYQAWRHMHTRCYNPKSTRFHQWGGRGIQVCGHWHRSNPTGFENFVRDMGLKPAPDLSIDRINPDGNYEPSNCRWATALQQRHNRSRLVFPSLLDQEKYWQEKDRQVHAALRAALYDDERYTLEQTEATCDWFDSRGDGHGESNAERNL